MEGVWPVGLKLSPGIPRASLGQKDEDEGQIIGQLGRK